jgi:hypothetical protein
MKLFRVCIIMVTVVLTLSQCKITTGGDEPTPTASKTELLAGKTSKAWVLTSSKIDGVEVFNQASNCTKDDNMLFRADKIYEWNEGKSKCRTQDPQVYETGTWEFNSGETEIILNKELRYKILKLTDNALQISIKNVFGETEELTFKPN